MLLHGVIALRTRSLRAGGRQGGLVMVVRGQRDPLINVGHLGNLGILDLQPMRLDCQGCLHCQKDELEEVM